MSIAPAAPATPAATRKPRNLAQALVSSLSERIRAGRLAVGAKLPTEAAIMDEFGVSRTVVREALSKLQAGGLVETRHGIGTFVRGSGEVPGFRIAPEQLGTLRDVVAVLELRIGIETEAAALAAVRRQDANISALRQALDDLAQALEAGRSAVGADFQFHLEIARATQNSHFADLMGTLGRTIIPRARLEPGEALNEEGRQYLKRVNGEHESIFDAILNQDPEAARAAMRTHLTNSRERRRRAELGSA